MFNVFKVHSPDGVNFYHGEAKRLIVSPDGNIAVWLRPLDLATGHFQKYDNWIDATTLSDEEFEALVRRLQSQ